MQFIAANKSLEKMPDRSQEYNTILCYFFEIPEESVLYLRLLPPKKCFFWSFFPYPNIMHIANQWSKKVDKAKCNRILNKAKAYGVTGHGWVSGSIGETIFEIWLPIETKFRVFQYFQEQENTWKEYSYTLGVRNKNLSEIMSLVNDYFSGKYTAQIVSDSPLIAANRILFTTLIQTKLSLRNPYEQRIQSARMIAYLKWPVFFHIIDTYISKRHEYEIYGELDEILTSFLRKMNEKYPFLSNDYFESNLVNSHVPEVEKSSLPEDFDEAEENLDEKAKISKNPEKITLDEKIQNPIWEYALDEEGEDGQDESWERPLPDYTNLSDDFLNYNFPLLTLKAENGMYVYAQWMIGKILGEFRFWDGTKWVWDYPGQPTDFPLYLTTLIPIESHQRTFLLEKPDSRFAFPDEKPPSHTKS